MKEHHMKLPVLGIFALAAAFLLAGCSGITAEAAQAPGTGVGASQPSALQLGQVLVTGEVTGVSGDAVTVGDLTFRTDDQTQAPANLAVGSQAQVLAIRLPDNTHYALEIYPAAAAAASADAASGQPRVSDDESGEFEMYGLVQSIGAAEWRISDMAFQVAPGIEIKGDIREGDAVKVEGALIGGSMVAREIELQAGESRDDSGGDNPSGGSAFTDDDDHELYGVVESTGPVWVISGTSFVVDAATEIKGSITPGSQVKVHYIQQSDGSFMATEIEFDDDSGDDFDDNSGDFDDDSGDDFDDDSDDGGDDFDDDGDDSSGGDDDDDGDDHDDDSGGDDDHNDDDGHDDD